MRYCLAPALLLLMLSCQKDEIKEAILPETFLVSGGGRGSDILRDMDVDPDGNIYLTGKTTMHFNSDTSWFPPLTAKGVGGEDIVTVKYNKYGKAIWVNSSGGTGWDEGEAIAAGKDGHCFVAGVFSGTARFNGTQLTIEKSFNGSGMPNQMDMFLARYDEQGRLVWVRQVSGYGYERPTAIVLDPSGNILVTGYFYQHINFNGTAISTRGSSFFIAKYNPNGDLLWAKSFGNSLSGDMYPDDMAIDIQGNITIGGSFSGIQDFGGTSLHSQLQDNFVARYSNNGQLIWARKLDSTGDDIGYCVAVDDAGNTYFGGLFQSTLTADGITIQSNKGWDAFWAKFSNTGQLQWLKSAGGNGEDGVRDVYVRHDTLYSIGYFMEDLAIDNQTITGSPIEKAFLTRHDLNGNLMAVQTLSIGTGLPVKIYLDKSGYQYMGGYFLNTVTLGGLNRNTSGGYDFFLWKNK